MVAQFCEQQAVVSFYGVNLDELLYHFNYSDQINTHRHLKDGLGYNRTCMYVISLFQAFK